MELDLQNATLGIIMQLAQRQIRQPGDIYLFSDTSYARFETFGSAVFCNGEVQIGDSPLTDIIARELAKPQTIGIATHSRSVFEYLLKSGTVVVLGFPGVTASLFGPQIGSINITTVSVPAGDPNVLGKLNYIAGSRNPGEDVGKMRDIELLGAESIPVYHVQQVPEALLARPFTEPNKPEFSVEINKRIYPLFV